MNRLIFFADTNSNERNKQQDQHDDLLLLEPRPLVKPPPLYKILMFNDDFTPMEFVVLVLQRFFKMPIEEATNIMLMVHQKGVGNCGIFSYDIATTKVQQVMNFARKHQHPLQLTLEKI